jgi:hypothetical protein
MPFFNPNLLAPTAFAVSRFHDTSFFNDPPPYVLSAPIEALETYLFPSVPASRVQPLEEMDSEQHGDLTTTPGAQPSTTEAPERFSPEEEEVLSYNHLLALSQSSKRKLTHSLFFSVSSAPRNSRKLRETHYLRRTITWPLSMPTTSRSPARPHTSTARPRSSTPTSPPAT